MSSGEVDSCECEIERNDMEVEKTADQYGQEVVSQFGVKGRQHSAVAVVWATVQNERAR